MAEYIEREKLSFHLASEIEFYGEANESYQPIAYGSMLGLKTALSYVNTLPTADVAPVIHGEWIEDGYAEKPCVCSHCGEEAQYISRFEETFDYDWDENLQSTGYEEIREYIKTPYCPNCGAEMDGGKS